MTTKRDVLRDILNGAIDLETEDVAAIPVDRTESGDTRPLNESWAKRLVKIQAYRKDQPEQFRDELQQLSGQEHLSDGTIDDLLDIMRTVIEEPDFFYDAVVAPSAQESGQREGRTRGWLKRLLAYFGKHRQITAEQRAILDEMSQRYVMFDDIKVNPNIKKFETFDPRWIPLWNEYLGEVLGKWPDLAPFLEHDDSHDFVYPADGGDGDAIRVGVMADFGTGYYHSLHIARQLTSWRYPYVFHLGDVYYGGTESETRTFYEEPLRPLLEAGSKLFNLAENHELYSGGQYFVDYLKKMYGEGLILQEGCYFCVRFPNHQLIGVDVNWLGRQEFKYQKSVDWLRQILDDGGTRTNVLMTGSAPYVYGDEESSALFEDFKEFVDKGQIHLWFWGDNHYCALFQRDADKANFVGSCIGHGGYPGGKRDEGSESYVPYRWLESSSRFPEWTEMRQDMGNNGWCELTLRPDGGVELLYVDWLSCKQYKVAYKRSSDAGDSFHLEFESETTYTGRESRTGEVALHRPGA